MCKTFNAFEYAIFAGAGPGAALIIVTALMIVTTPGIVTIILIVAKRFNKHLT